MLQLSTHDDQPGQPGYVRHVAYLSFGCVLRRLYARYFPAYFSVSTLAEVAGKLDGNPRTNSNADEVRPRWRNLWRYSDYLGGPVAAGPPPRRTAQLPGLRHELSGGAPIGRDVDVQFVDPVFRRPAGDVIFPAPSRHSNYWYDPAFAATVAVLADTVVSDTSVADTSVADTSVADTSVADRSSPTDRSPRCP